MIVKPEKANSHIRGSNSPSAPIKTIIQQYSDYQCGSSRKSWIWCIKNWFVLCVPLYCPEISNLLMIQKYFIISLHILFLFIVSFLFLSQSLNVSESVFSHRFRQCSLTVDHKIETNANSNIYHLLITSVNAMR